MKICLFKIGVFFAVVAACKPKNSFDPHVSISNNATRSSKSNDINFDIFEYRDLTFKDAISRIVYSESSPDLVDDNWQSKPGYIFCAPASIRYKKEKPSFDDRPYNRNRLLETLALGMGLQSRISNNFFIISPIKEVDMNSISARISSLDSYETIKSCRLGAIEGENLMLSELIQYLNERFRGKGLDLFISDRSNRGVILLDVSFNNISAEDLLVVLGGVGGFKFSEVKDNTKTIVLQ